MKGSAVARRYARAILGCAQSEKQLETLGGELAGFASVYGKNPLLRKALAHPRIPAKNKENVLERVAEKEGLSEKCRKALAVILKNGRISFLPDIAESFIAMANEKQQRVRVELVSAYPLLREEIKTLEERFCAITGKAVMVEEKTDGSLIGGLVARVGSKVYDGSVKNQLRLLKVRLEQEG